jgi:hypothetical protein
MQKTAQKRSLLNKLREVTNISGIATEKFFNPEFQELMDRLRDQTDDPIRSIVSGEAIGNASPPDDAISLKELLKGIKSNINRREYMTAVASLSRFYHKMHDVVDLLKKFNSNVDKIHEKFLFEGLDEDNKRHLRDLKKRLSAYDQARDAAFIKEANILDFFTNIATERGRALAAWEKRYPKQLGKLKKDTGTMLQQAERLLSTTLSALKEMATARATRNPDNYIKVGNDKIVKGFEAFDRNFKEYYNSNVKGFLEKQQFAMSDAATDPAASPTNPQASTIPAAPLGADLKGDTVVAPVVVPKDTLKDAPVVPAPSVSIPNIIDTTVGLGTLPKPALPTIPPLPKIPKILQAPPSPPSPSTPRDTIDTGKPKKVKPAHQDFMESLQALSEESPILLAQHIRRYAKSIQSYDLETSVKLFKLAQSIGE